MTTQKTEPKPVRTEETSAEQHSGGNPLLRLYWMALGNFLLLVAAMLISKQDAWTITLLDLLYLAIVGSLLLARYIDIARYKGETTNCEPATKRHWKRYAAGLVAVGGALWAAVQAVTV